MSDHETSLRPIRELPRLALVALGLLAAGMVALSFRLWPEWRHNPDLSHGLFMPLIFLLLLHEARQGTPRFLRDSVRTRLGLAGLLAAGFAALAAAGLYAAAVDWTHPLAILALTTAFVAFLGAGLVVLSADGVRALGFNWNAVAALVLWFLCTPIPPGTYSRLTLSLQLWVSEAVLRSLHVLGVAAIRHGNIIELARTTVGVEEACSGVRSLISCVFAGVFFSATLVRRPAARAAVILLSGPLALVMNFLRSLTLTLLSNSGVDISGKWHDVTGFAVLGITAVLLAGLALLLQKSGQPRQPPATAPLPRGLPRGQLRALAASCIVAVVVIGLSVANTRSSPVRTAAVPDLEALLPGSPDGWSVATANDLYQFKNTLQTDHLAQRMYRKQSPDGHLTEVILYAAYWSPGVAPVSLVASHTPDACWPGSGWTPRKVAQPREKLTTSSRVLPDAEYRLFTFGDAPQHVWYWHLYDGHPIAYQDPYSPTELLRIAWKYGFGHDGDQLFIRVSSNRPWSELRHEPLLEEFFKRSQRLGL